VITVTLTDYELRLAAFVGQTRNAEAIALGLRDTAGFTGGHAHGLQLHILGAAGELAFAKACDRYWGGSTGTFRTEGDVGSIEVRTRSRDDYDLLVRANDKPDSFYVLVTGAMPTFKVWGYITGADAKRPEWAQTYGNRPPAFFVPKAALTPIETALG
jgi:hypothetical protein